MTNGRDISKLSAVKGEKEVLILPGTNFLITAVREVDGPTTYPALVKKAQDQGQPLPKKWYAVSMTRIPNQPLPKTPTPPTS